MESAPLRPSGRGEHSREKTSRWDNKLDFFMAAISTTVGLGNLWRFPYIAYRNGGGAFLIPYLLMTIIIGFPLVTLELTLGQYGHKGVVGVWDLCPLFQGIGWSICIMVFLLDTYYVMLMAYSMYYVIASFSATLPWTTCNNAWNTANCVEEVLTCHQPRDNLDNTSCVPDYHNINSTAIHTNSSVSFPSEEYFNNHVLALSSGLDEIGGVQWPLAMCLLLSWSLIVLGLSMGTKSWGKLSYVTALLPYVVMLALLIQACLKVGAKDGILYFVTPVWTRLATARVWSDAAIQVFFSVSCGWGCFITMGKHNHFRNNPIIDAGVLVVGDFITSIFSGLIIFAIIGQMSAQINVPINDVVQSGPGLAFVVYPRAVTYLPVPQLWSVLFFFMLTNLGLGTALAPMATILDSLTEEIEQLSTKRNRLITLMCLAAASFLFGLIYTTSGGIYVLTLMDSYGPPMFLLVVCLLEVLVVAWIYGSGNLLSDLSLMTGWHPKYLYIFMVFWRGLCPSTLICVLVSMALNWYTPSYGDYIFPMWANVVGWMVTILQLLPIPALIIYKLCMAKDRQELADLIRPTADWGAEAKEELINYHVFPIHATDLE